MKYIEGRHGLEGRNGNNNNNRAEERNSSCNTLLIFPGTLCDGLVRTRKCCRVITSVSEMANPLGRNRASSSLVFKHPPGCFLGVRKAKPTFPFACSMLKSIASATTRTFQRCPCVSLLKSEASHTEITIHVRKYQGSLQFSGYWRFREFRSISNPYSLTCCESGGRKVNPHIQGLRDANELHLTLASFWP